MRLTEEEIESLDARIGGAIVRPDDEGWDDAVLIWNALAAKVPALVVQPVSARDVATAVRSARTHGVLLSVKGGGHNIAGTAMTDGGLTLDMSRMCAVTVDPDVRLVNAGPGCRLRSVSETKPSTVASPCSCVARSTSPSVLDRRELRQLPAGRGRCRPDGRGVRHQLRAPTAHQGRVRAEYDPDNLFRRNRNVSPAAAERRGGRSPI